MTIIRVEGREKKGEGTKGDDKKRYGINALKLILIVQRTVH